MGLARKKKLIQILLRILANTNTGSYCPNGGLRENGLRNLRAIQTASNMLICGEDLGDCPPEVMIPMLILILMLSAMCQKRPSMCQKRPIMMIPMLILILILSASSGSDRSLLCQKRPITNANTNTDTVRQQWL
jgi:hypothetical protein